MSWDLQDSLTTVYGDGFTETDLTELDRYASSNSDSILCHPYAIMVFLAELLDFYYTAMGRNLAGEIGLLEKELGITRGNTGFVGWGWEPELFRTYTQRCYRLTVGPVYLERRLVFLISWCNFLLDCLRAMDQELPHDYPQRDQIRRHTPALEETIRNTLQLANGRLHQSRCLEKRLHNLMSTVSPPSAVG